MDLSMFQNQAQVQLPDPYQQQVRQLTLGTLASRAKMEEFTLAEAARKQKIEQDAARELPALMQSGWSPEAVQAAAQRSPEAIGALLATRKQQLKDDADINKTNADASKSKAEAHKVNSAILSGLALNLADKPDLSGNDVQQYMSTAKSLGIDDLDKTMPRNGFQSADDVRGWFKNNASLGMDAAKQMEFAVQKRGQDLTYQAADEGHQVTREGQQSTAQTAANALDEARSYHQGELGVQRGRLDLERNNASKPVIQTDQQGNIFTIDPRAGTGRQVVGEDGQPLNKGDKPLTETQGNAVAFGMRANSANDIINKLEDSGANLANDPRMLAAKSRVGNVVAGDDAQRAQQAKLNFMSATLRKESGAAISPSEYDAEDRKYFPQPGDGPANIAQKREARALAIETLKAQAGQSGEKKIAATSSAGDLPAKPKLGEKRQGYIFNGGDPANPDSWKKVGG